MLEYRPYNGKNVIATPPEDESFCGAEISHTHTHTGDIHPSSLSAR
jgi:hypothetical protein